MVHATLTPFTVYDLAMGILTAVGVVYLLYTKQFVLKYRRFLYYLGAGFLLFAVGGPLTYIFVPEWIHLVHGVSALFVVLGLYNPVHNDLRDEEWVELLFQEPGQIRHPKEWMRPVDERILELFHSSDLVLTPSIIAYNIEYSSKEVNRRLSELEDHGFVERVERGKYQMTDIGELYLQGRLDRVYDESQAGKATH